MHSILDEKERSIQASGIPLGDLVREEKAGDDGRLLLRIFRSPAAESVLVHWDDLASVLRGPVAGAWRDTLAGRALYPLGDSARCEDGIGECAHFVERDGHAFASIYHHPAAGTALVHGAIRDRWLQLGGERGALGYPAGSETPSHTGRARLQRFLDPATGALAGIVAAHADGLAFATLGPIHARWVELGGDRALGDPTTDVLPCPDGVGTFAHFRDGAGEESSLYHTPQTGAHAVRGPIRALWAERGWEKGELGYPVAGEVLAEDGTRTTRFQHGAIEWSPAHGARRLP